MAGIPFGRYELLRKIAAGGMAEVFLAREWGKAGFFHDLVIKRLFPHLVEHEPTLRSFQYEARLMAELRHPNIPRVTDLGSAERTWYIAMEYVEGLNVADVWRAGAKLGVTMPLPVALGITMQICEALHHAHDRTDRAGSALAIVHRDVTPQNVILTRDGVAKLMDFGIAQTAANRDKERGSVKGTYSYMAPEQVRGWVVDRRADVFSAGVILYELTTGTRLFRGTDVQVMTAVVESDVPRPSTRVLDYPADLEEIVLDALCRDRERRTPSAAELTERLEDFAMRHGLLVGPRALASHVQQVLPAARVPEQELAMVQPLELTRRRSNRPGEPSPTDDHGFNDEATEVLSELPDLDDDDDPPPLAGRAARGALLGFDDASKESGPVVLLETRKPPAEAEDYVRGLRRRIEDDERR